MTDAGRRVLIRVVGAPLLISAIAGILYVDHLRERPTGLVILVGGMSCLALHELCAMMRLKGIRPFEPAALIALALLLAAQLPGVQYRGWASALQWASLGAAASAVLVTAFVRGMKAAGATLAATGYAALAVFLVFMAAPLPLIFLFATNKGSDMAAYSVGKLIGRHKLAPKISPHKTWEGAIAGLLVGAGAGVAILGLSRGAIVMAVVVTIAAQAGDLVKSAVKRWAGVKDSGRLLPEFGGALDMIDSFLVSAPVFWLLVRVNSMLG